MIKIFIFIFCLAFSEAQYAYPGSYDGAPNPYEFSYSSPAIGGASSHQESGDGNGRVTGSYSVTDDDGRSRTVEYVADEQGFRANIVTNEPGTSNQAPADVTISSSADDGVGGLQSLAAPYGAAPIGYSAAPAPIPYRGAPLSYGAYGGGPQLIPLELGY